MMIHVRAAVEARLNKARQEKKTKEAWICDLLLQLQAYKNDLRRLKREEEELQASLESNDAGGLESVNLGEVKCKWCSDGYEPLNMTEVDKLRRLVIPDGARPCKCTVLDAIHDNQMYKHQKDYGL